ncbi:MAG: type I restriction enzyme HsdR N-terminal domain-containing protein [Bacteroidales bacterium]|nr:type I restriction enzyme HsdR N-terminal domain-containing protein [Bacteroidales bacterium]
MIYKLSIPEYPLTLRTDDDNRQKVFDPLRRCWVALTPEEWVRQQMFHYLTEHLEYPASRMTHEHSIVFNGLKKRCDGVVFASNGTPQVIMEYKAPTIHITQKVFDQIAIYNMQLHVPYLLISNGMQHFFCQIDFEQKKYVFARDILPYTLL